jgi:hypothetical protein
LAVAWQEYSRGLAGKIFEEREADSGRLWDLLDLQSFAEVDSPGKIERISFPFGKKKTFAREAPLGLAVASVNLFDPRILNLKLHASDRNFNLHSEIHAAHLSLVHPDLDTGFMGRCNFVFH